MASCELPAEVGERDEPGREQIERGKEAIMGVAGSPSPSVCRLEGLGAALEAIASLDVRRSRSKPERSPSMNREEVPEEYRLPGRLSIIWEREDLFSGVPRPGSSIGVVELR